MKVVLNACHGNFELSHKGVQLYSDLKGLDLKFEEDKSFVWTGGYWYSSKPLKEGAEQFRKDRYHFSPHSLERTDPILVQVVEQLGEESNGEMSMLKVVEVPDDTKWKIVDYDGKESVHEEHRSWS